jgi:hypothetical protein
MLGRLGANRLSSRASHRVGLALPQCLISPACQPATMRDNFAAIRRAAPAIYLTTADVAVRLQEQPVLEPPPRCRADNPKRPAGSGRSCRLPRGPC